MKILRIRNVNIINSSNIDITFNESLTPNLVVGNASIISQSANVPDSKVLAVSVSNNILSITCQPLTPYSSYLLQFQSIVNSPFISVNGDAQISPDGVSNVFLISGPIQSDNPVLDYLQSFYRNNIYNITDPTTVVSSYIQSVAVNFAQALYDIKQLKNENYLSFDVVDEAHLRGTGPFDRLNEESVYNVTRVGFGPTNAPVSNSFVFSDFPNYPITLQRQFITENIKVSSNNDVGTFNINTLTFNLSNRPVSRVDSIVFTLTTTHPVYTYNLSTLGYQILNSEYDQANASSYLLLENNQIKINEAILQDPLFSLDQIFSINITYEYQGLGIIVDPTSIDVFTTLQSVREVLPPITNIFNLKHAPITDSSNNNITVNGLTLINPNSNGMPHPAFLLEIPFSLSALPSSPGVFAVDYLTGTVYVYGADFTNDGTGPSPPLASYYYQFTYTSEIDYVYDLTTSSIVALPLGNLLNNVGIIDFNYQQVLIPGIDYNADTHIESLNEPINNNLIALNALTTQNSPITDVFQIYNQTSGEIYLLDRWNNNTVYFRYNNPPRILSETGENVSFAEITNELLTVNTTSIINGITILTIYLANNNIISSTQDCIGSSINSSLTFTNGNVFVSEIWYNQNVNVSNNINRLSVGEYTVDYINGIIYVAGAAQDLGTANYKMNDITPNFPHLISVNDIYYRISVLNPVNKKFSYISFENNSIIPANLDFSDESLLNGVALSPYQLLNTSVGAFVDETFVPGVSNAVKFVRSVYEYNDLFNNKYPLNFVNVSNSNNFNINVNSITNQSFETIQFDGTNYYILLNLNLSYLSPDITYNFSMVRTSDSQQLWNNSGTIVVGSPIKLILPGINSPAAGEVVNVNYTFTINNLSRVVVDYNKGDFFIDYNYLADEILVSYEYGDNQLDFRQNTNLPAGSQYYVSYQVGALRSALLANFGTLVNVPDLANFDLTLNRERYRDALYAALSSFIQGPTVAAIKNIVQTITHIEPQVIESAFQVWSLGSNLLTPVGIQTTGEFQLLPAHFNNGVLINTPSQTITLPVNSNLRLEEGTFETWIIPQWNGLDNDAEITFNILQDGNPIQPSKIFISGSEYHPNNNIFTLNKSDGLGTPNLNKDGIFIYYDTFQTYQRWYVQVVDGYINPANHIYKIEIITNGKFYDNKPFNKSSNLSVFSGTNKINLTITPLAGNIGINEGLTFVADVEHYLLDFGLNINANRLSIYKDVSGYINFRVFDKNQISSTVSANVSSWIPGVAHMVAASWKLNTVNSRDEMHLFIDGLEVPNIISYGQKSSPNEKFRTINPEEIVGLSNRDIVGSDDLTTTINTPFVSSSINFSQYNVDVGDSIDINESGFGSYIIQGIDGQTLTLNQNLPSSITNGKFSINQTSFDVSSNINVVPNISVSTIHTFISGTLNTIVNNNQINSTTNFTTSNVLPGFLLRIDNVNFNLTYEIIAVNNNILTLNAKMPISLSGLIFQIYSNTETELPGVRALDPDYIISQDGYFNNILTITNGVLENDLILINTLGLNYRNVNQSCYIWSNGVENVLMTQLPAPISLDQVNITKILLPNTVVGLTNSTIVGNQFISNHITMSQPSNTTVGRTISATISGTNINFTTPTAITINGMSGMTVISETITFNNYETLNFVTLWTEINYVQVNTNTINPAKNALAIKIQETDPITQAQSNEIVPVIRYSYSMGSGTNLTSFGNMATDPDYLFSYADVNNYLIVSSVGYLITGLLSDRHSVIVNTTLPSFSNTSFQVLNTTDYRSGLQNGFFTFETTPGQPWYLNNGTYQLNYATYLSVKFQPLNNDFYIGTDFNGNNIVNGIMDQFTLNSIMLTDTRIGEVVVNNIGSVTKDFNSLTVPTANMNTLVLITFDNFPFTNSASFYAATNNDHIHFQSDFAVNDNFDQSIVILDKPILVPNLGILNTTSQATIEFWMSPLFDTANDPNDRFYFDAYGAIVEQISSVSNVVVKLNNPASKILSVSLANGDPKVDYFAGGKLEIDTQNAIQEDIIPQNINTITVSNPILQVITVKIVGDFTGTDYFNNGSISSNKKTIYLGTALPSTNLEVIVIYQTTNNNNTTLNSQVIRLNKELPAQNCLVSVKYIPAGLQGDRISVFKDIYGYINFGITASNIDYVIRAETRLAKNTWHRIKASYQVNSGVGTDNMRLFIDGYEYTDVYVGPDQTPGQFPVVIGSNIGDGYNLISSIVFKDSINNFWIGSDYNNTNPIFTLLDNLRISNIARPIYAPYGEPIDVNYSNNLSVVFPVTQDLYTTYLLDFNTEVALITNFATLIDRSSGGFDFTVNVFDDFGIVASNPQIKQILESLINILSPGTSTPYIKYIN
jgi:hypothetical protein